jgi:flagellin
MIINHNLAANNAIRNMNTNSTNASKSMQKLSSGLRINSASDDAAGLAISEKMRGQIRGLDQASANAQDGISMVNTAEGALNETTSILQRMRELAVQASNDTNTTDDRTQIQKEMNQLTSEVSRIGNTTEFNTQKLINGTGGDKTAAQVAVSATTFATQQTGTNTGVKYQGTYNGTSDITLTIKWDNAGSKYQTSTDGTNFTDVTWTGSTATVEGLTLTKPGSNPLADQTDTVSLTAAKAATPASSAFTFQIGANQDQQFTAHISDMRSAALGIAGTAGDDATGVNGDISGASFVDVGTTNDLTDGSQTSGTVTEHALDVSTSAKATAAIKVLDEATARVSDERAKLGAYSNRLDHTIANLGTSSENLTSAESRIRDVDMAKEMSTFSKNNILAQAAQAMLAQANQQPQQVLQLLR